MTSGVARISEGGVGGGLGAEPPAAGIVESLEVSLLEARGSGGGTPCARRFFAIF